MDLGDQFALFYCGIIVSEVIHQKGIQIGLHLVLRTER
jgi:hypothetical protein